jgi:hypothetical protein
VVDALERIHMALREGGVVVDTQPVSAEPPVTAADEPLGRLDMREWAETISAVDELVIQAVDRGLFRLGLERRFPVTDSYDDASEFLAVVGGWQGTQIPGRLAKRAVAAPGPIEVVQEVRMRLLHRI